MTFYFMGRRGNDRSRIKIGRYPRMNPQEARKVALGYEKGWQVDGVNPAEAIRKEKTAITTKELFDIYIEEQTRGRGRRRPRSPKTIKDYRLQFNKHIEPPFGRLPVTQLTRPDIVKWHKKMPRTQANRCVVLLKAMLNYAVDFHDLPKNPVGPTDFLNEECTREDIIPDDKLAAFWRACGLEDCGDYFKLCLLTGQREAQVQEMKWADSTLDQPKPFWVPWYEGGKPVRVAISKHCAAILRARKGKVGNGPFVFPDPENPDRPQPIQKRAWDRITKAAGLYVEKKHPRNLHIHDLRRTFASHLRRIALPDVCSVALTHKLTGMLAIYCRVTPEEVWDKVNEMNTAMLALINAKPKAEPELAEASA